MKYTVAKLMEGYSVCFRQWRANHSHCKYLHGYALKFKLYFETINLNEYSWVWDFGWLKNIEYHIDNMSVAKWFSHMFDHTVIIARDDPHLGKFQNLQANNLVQLRIIDNVSCEKIAEYILIKVGALIENITDGNVKVPRVDVFENDVNCASAEITISY